MRFFVVSSISRILVTFAAFLCLTFNMAHAQKQKDLSDKAVQIMSALATKLVRDKERDGKGRVLNIDKSKPETFMIPLDDARHVIKTGRVSAHAHICRLLELEARNYLTMMAVERARKKWSKPQLVFINRLHLFTVMWMSGSAEIAVSNTTSRSKKKSDVEKTDKKVEAAKANRKQCTKAEIARIEKQVEASIKAAQARLKKS